MEPATPARQPDWRKRLEGLVPLAVESRGVLIVGCGSVGSFMAGELARAGVRRFALVDPDVVEWANLTRTAYLHRDLGRPKVEALRDHLQSVFPDIEASAHAVTVQALGDEFRAALAAADLVISAVDQPAAHGRINRLAYAAGKAALFVGLYKGARGGEIITTLPGRTPCFHCSTGGVRKVTEDESAEKVVRTTRDYGTNRLVAEVALGSDIHFVCCAGVKLALSLLSAGSGGPLDHFLGRQLEEGGNFLMLGMEPDYYIFPSTHGSAVGQYAFQSLWLSTSSDPDCEVCGSTGGR